MSVELWRARPGWRGHGLVTMARVSSRGHRPPRHRTLSDLGVRRWVVEQSIALLHWFWRLRIRWGIPDDIHQAFLSLACAIICRRRLRNLSPC